MIHDVAALNFGALSTRETLPFLDGIAVMFLRQAEFRQVGPVSCAEPSNNLGIVTCDDFTSDGTSANDERQLKAVMEFRKAYSAQALEGSNIPKVRSGSRS